MHSNSRVPFLPGLREGASSRWRTSWFGSGHREGTRGSGPRVHDHQQTHTWPGCWGLNRLVPQFTAPSHLQGKRRGQVQGNSLTHSTNTHRAPHPSSHRAGCRRGKQGGLRPAPGPRGDRVRPDLRGRAGLCPVSARNCLSSSPRRMSDTRHSFLLLPDVCVPPAGGLRANAVAAHASNSGPLAPLL